MGTTPTEGPVRNKAGATMLVKETTYRDVGNWLPTARKRP